MKRRVGLFGGSFNPVHIGHTLVASYIAQFADVDEVWLVLSPLNPLKRDSNDLVADDVRLEMLNEAVSGTPFLKVCDIELGLPRPSYTLVTMRVLAEKYPECSFRWIVGSDNWLRFSDWRNPAEIVGEFGLIVYPRPGYAVDVESLPPGVEYVEAPQVELSSTFIRNSIAKGYDMNLFLPPRIYRYILTHNLYQN